MFGLILVEARLSREENARALERLGEELNDLGLCFLDIELDYLDWDPSEQIARGLEEAQNAADVVILRGLERTPPARMLTDERPPAYARLNVAREGLERSLDIPLIVWCGGHSFGELRQHAPDFFDHFLGIVHFEDGTPEPSTDQKAPESEPRFLIDLSRSRPPSRRAAWEFYRDRLDQPESDPGDRRRWILGLAGAARKLNWQAREEREEAIAWLQEVLDDPSSSAEESARAHAVLGQLLHKLERYRDASEATFIAVALYKKLASERPEEFSLDLVDSLEILAIHLEELGRLEEGLEAVSHLVAIRRRLAHRDSESFLRSLAFSLFHRGTLRNRLGEIDEALDDIQESVGILRDSESDREEPADFALASTLLILGQVLHAAGRHEEALRALEESLQGVRDLEFCQPGSYLPHIATTLSFVALLLKTLGKRKEALRAVEECSRLVSHLASRSTTEFGPSFAKLLETHGSVLSSLEHHAQVVQVLSDGLSVLLPLAEQEPGSLSGEILVLVQKVEKAGQAAGIEPDADLLAQAKAIYEDAA